MLPVSTRIEMPRKWLISSSSAVSRSSPICFALVPDGLHRGLRKRPFTDKAAHLFFVGQRFVAPMRREGLLLAVEHDCLGNLPLLPQRSEGLLCCRAVAKHQGGFETAAHGRGGELKVFLRVLLEREDRGRAQQQPDQRHEITTLITLMRRSARLNVGRDVCEKSLFMWFLPGKHQDVRVNPNPAVRQNVQINGEADPVVVDDQAKRATN